MRKNLVVGLISLVICFLFIESGYSQDVTIVTQGWKGTNGSMGTHIVKHYFNKKLKKYKCVLYYADTGASENHTYRLDLESISDGEDDRGNTEVHWKMEDNNYGITYVIITNKIILHKFKNGIEQWFYVR